MAPDTMVATGNAKAVDETPSQGDFAMSSTHGTTWLERTSVSTRHVSSFIWKYWDAFRERRERQQLRATLSNLSDRELMDIGTTRGEIDYVASHRGIDPRGIRSGEWLRYRQR
jgi:uncharacterized protein YjiS (DUF1127 family)